MLFFCVCGAGAGMRGRGGGDGCSGHVDFILNFKIKVLPGIIVCYIFCSKDFLKGISIMCPSHKKNNKISLNTNKSQQ